jgi:hypothetical protein
VVTGLFLSSADQLVDIPNIIPGSTFNSPVNGKFSRYSCSPG